MKVFGFDSDGFIKQKRNYYPIKVSNPHLEFINQSMRLQYENKNQLHLSSGKNINDRALNELEIGLLFN